MNAVDEVDKELIYIIETYLFQLSETNLIQFEDVSLRSSEACIRNMFMTRSLCSRERWVGPLLVCACCFWAAGGAMVDMDEPGLSSRLEAMPAVVDEEVPHGTDLEAGILFGDGQPQEEPTLVADEAPFDMSFEVGSLLGDGQAHGQQVLDKGPVFTEKERANYERTIFEQSLASIGAGMPALPWEQGIFKEIFGEAKSDNLPTLEDLVAYPAGATPGSSDDARLQVEVTGVTSSLPGDLPLYAKHIKAMCDRDYAATLDLTWTKALASWLIVLEDCNFESSVGRYVQEKLQSMDRDGALLCIKDACGVRSPSTVLKRARDLILFVKWCEKNDLRWWPIKERNLLDYILGEQGG